MLRTRKPFVIGGIIASFILIAFGLASVVVGIQGRNEVNDTLAKENIVAPDDSTIPGQKVDTGSEAKAMANIMREHTLKSSGGLTYAEMGKYRVADGAPAGTNDAALAVKDANGKPLSNPVRDLWVTETALTTALNTSYFASQVGLFAIVMGIALLLTGIGFGVLTVGAFWKAVLVSDTKAAETADAAPVRTGGPATVL